jgi:hypothetical protein
MNSALPPPVLTGTKRSRSFDTWIVHGAMTTANAATIAAAASTPCTSPRRRAISRSASSANSVVSNRYSGRRYAVSPNSAPGTSHAHPARPSSAAHRNASIAPATVSIAIGSLLSSPV